MAHKKGGGSSRNGRDSNPQYLGVKAYAGENSSWRQYFWSGNEEQNSFPAPMLAWGKDYTLFAKNHRHSKV